MTMKIFKGLPTDWTFSLHICPKRLIIRPVAPQHFYGNETKADTIFCTYKSFSLNDDFVPQL